MSGVAGYKAQLKLGGVPTIFTNLPLVEINDGFFRMTDAIKKVLSANYLIVVSDDNGITQTDYKINYLEGIIYFPVNPEFAPRPFAITGRYIPLEFIGGSKEYSLEIGGDILDDTAFHSNTELSAGYRTKQNGIHDISVSFSRWNNFDKKLQLAKIAKTPIFVSVNPGGSATFAKGWYIIETDSLSGDIGSLEDESLSLSLCGNNAKTYFSYSRDVTDGEAVLMTIPELENNYFPA